MVKFTSEKPASREKKFLMKIWPCFSMLHAGSLKSPIPEFYQLSKNRKYSEYKAVSRNFKTFLRKKIRLSPSFWWKILITYHFTSKQQKRRVIFFGFEISIRIQNEFIHKLILWYSKFIVFTTIWLPATISVLRFRIEGIVFSIKSRFIVNNLKNTFLIKRNSS